MISIIVTVFNAQSFLSQCLDSILAQTLTYWECLLIDDASTDDSLQLCQQYAQRDARFYVIAQPVHSGVSAARQLGLNHATGQYVIHADSDDRLEPQMLQELRDTAIRQEADLVICDYYDDRSVGSALHHDSYVTTHVNQQPSGLDAMSLMLDIIRQRLIASCWNKLLRRSLINQYQLTFPKAINFCEDVCFFAQLFTRCSQLRVSYVANPLYHYCHRSDTLSLVFAYSPSITQSDLSLYHTLAALLDPTPLAMLSRQRWAYTIVRRAYDAHCHGSLQFAHLFFGLRRQVWSYAPRRYAILLYLSCVGLYRLVYRIDRMLIVLHRMLIHS